MVMVTVVDVGDPRKLPVSDKVKLREPSTAELLAMGTSMLRDVSPAAKVRVPLVAV